SEPRHRARPAAHAGGADRDRGACAHSEAMIGRPACQLGSLPFKSSKTKKTIATEERNMTTIQRLGLKESSITRRSLLRRSAALGMGAGAIACLGRRAFAADLSSLKTVEPGTITVATITAMPMTDVKDGKFIGTDGEIISTIAAKLGL